MNLAAAAITVIALGCLAAIGALFGLWIFDTLRAHFERTEDVDLRSIRQWEQSRAALTRKDDK